MTILQTPQGEVFLIDPRHIHYVLDESAYLHDNTLNWSQRLLIGFVILMTFTLLASQLLQAEPANQANAEVIDTFFDEVTFEQFITVQFVLEDETYTAEKSVDAQQFRDAADGEVLIAYEADDPRIITILSSDRSAANGFILVATFALLIAAAYMMYFWIFRPDRINRQLEGEGVLLDGRIINSWPLNIGGRYQVSITYVFTTPNDRVIEKTSARTRPDLKKELLPKPGTPVRVLYVNERLYRLM